MPAVRHDLDMADQSQEPSSPLPILHPFVREHLGLLVAGSPLVLVALRLMQLSKGDPAVAAALLQTVNVSTVILATLTALLPVVLFLTGLMMLAGLGSFRKWLTHPSATVKTVFGAWFMLFTFVAATSSQLMALALVGGMTGLGVLNWWIRWKRKRRGVTTSELAPTEPIILALIILMIMLSQSPWLPQERIALETGTTRVGYVLNPGQEPTTVLWREGGLAYLKSTEIKERQPCRDGEGTSSWLRWRNQDETPKCPTAKVTSTGSASQNQ